MKKSYTGYVDGRGNKLYVGDNVIHAKDTGVIKHEEYEGHYIYFENGMKYRLGRWNHKITKIKGDKSCKN